MIVLRSDLFQMDNDGDDDARGTIQMMLSARRLRSLVRLSSFVLVLLISR